MNYKVGVRVVEHCLCVEIPKDLLWDFVRGFQYNKQFHNLGEITGLYAESGGNTSDDSCDLWIIYLELDIDQVGFFHSFYSSFCVKHNIPFVDPRK
jgi:hypothetical protein